MSASPDLPGDGTTPRVLVAYASDAGSTRGIAERIGARLEQAGLRANVAAAADAPPAAPYDAVVLGSAIHGGMWLDAARRLVERDRDALAARPLWLFSAGSFGDSHRVLGRLMLREPRDIAELTRTLDPRSYRVFAGVIERSRWPAPSRLLYQAFGGRFGDRRDWSQIDAWAASIATQIATDPDLPQRRATTAT